MKSDRMKNSLCSKKIKQHGDASVNGQDLDLLDESKGWYREAKHGREVQVEEIYVERIEKPVADAAKQEQGKENDNGQGTRERTTIRAK
jgi:hypothetical protein